MSAKINSDSLFIAAKVDDINAFEKLLAMHPHLLENCASTWAENPLLVACRSGSPRVVEAIIRLKPEFAEERNQEGFSAMDFASTNWDVAVVEALVKRRPKLCLVEDNQSLIPLHRAAIKGHGDVIRILVAACPESLQKVTSQEETVFHLAVKNNQCGSFEVLIEEVKKRDQEDILNRKDHEGNTVLHIAVSRKLIQIIEPLLACNSTNRVVVQVNSKNKDGHTAWDLHYQRPYYEVSREISRILQKAGAGPVKYSSPPSPRIQSPRTTNKRVLQRWSSETRSLLLVVLVMIAGAAFTASCNPPSVFFREKSVASATFHIWNMLFGPKRLPAIFYFMMFNTAGFSASMGTIVVLIWSLPCRAVLLFVVVMIFIVYALLVDETMPRFVVVIGSSNISSSCFAWLSALALIFLGVMVWILVKSFCCICTNLSRGRRQGEQPG